MAQIENGNRPSVSEVVRPIDVNASIDQFAQFMRDVVVATGEDGKIRVQNMVDHFTSFVTNSIKPEGMAAVEAYRNQRQQMGS